MLPPLELLLEAFAYGVLAPAGITVLGLWLALRRGRSGGPSGLYCVAAAAVGLLGGIAALVVSGQVQWEWRPTRSWHWLPWLACLTMLAGVIGRLPSLPISVRWLLCLIVAALAAWRLGAAESEVQRVGLWWYGALGVGTFALWGLLDVAAERRPGTALPALLALVALVAGIVLELAAFPTTAQLAGVQAAVLGACAWAAWRFPHAPVARALIPAVAVMLPGLLFVGYLNTYSAVPAASFILLFVAPCALAAAVLTTGSRPGHRQTALQAVAVLLPLAAAAYLAARA